MEPDLLVEIITRSNNRESSLPSSQESIGTGAFSSEWSGSRR